MSLLTAGLAVAGVGILLFLARPGSYASYLLGVERASFPHGPPGLTVEGCWDALRKSRAPHRGVTIADIDAIVCLEKAGLIEKRPPELPAGFKLVPEEPKSTPPQWEELERETLWRWTTQIWRWRALWIGLPFLVVIIGVACAALGLRRALLAIKALGPQLLSTFFGVHCRVALQFTGVSTASLFRSPHTSRTVPNEDRRDKGLAWPMGLVIYLAEAILTLSPTTFGSTLAEEMTPGGPLTEGRMEFRLRRIRFGKSYRVVGEEDPNPFERVAQLPNPGSPMQLCFHTARLTRLSGEQALIRDELAAPYRRRALEITCTPGDAPSKWGNTLTFDLERWSYDTGTIWVNRGETKLQTGIAKPRDWSYEVHQRLPRGGDQEKALVELLAALELMRAVDLVVTGDHDFLALRASWPLSLLPLVSPLEAFPIVALWSRAIGESYLAGPINIADWYPVVLARAIVRESWADFAVLIEGADAVPSGADFRELATSILTRLERAISTLDELARKWLRRSQYGGDVDLDQIVLGVSAIQDNLALLAGRFLGADLSNPFEWSLRSKAWRNEIANAGGERGQRLRQYVVEATPWLTVALALRHHAVHRSVLPTVVYDRFPNREDRLRLPADIVAEITQALDQLGESPSTWGIFRTRLAGDTSAELDPLPFAARLIAGTASLVNGVVRRVDPSGDSRYPDSLRAAARSGQTRFFEDRVLSPENCRIAVLSGPLSGLVEPG